jgi:hypothetical protein
MKEKKKTVSSVKETQNVAITITNQAKYLVLVPMPSRTTVHLGPGESSGPLPDTDVNQNLKLDKMVKAGLIRVNRPAPAKAKP